MLNIELHNPVVIDVYSTRTNSSLRLREERALLQVTFGSMKELRAWLGQAVAALDKAEEEARRASVAQ